MPESAMADDFFSLSGRDDLHAWAGGSFSIVVLSTANDRVLAMNGGK